jgi:hypothetical protein
MATSTATTTSSNTTATTIKPRVRLGSKPYTYHIESRTRAGVFYVLSAHHVTCTCPAGRARRGCWHLRLGLAWHDWRKRQQGEALGEQAQRQRSEAMPRPAGPARAGAASPRPTGMAALQEAVA